MVFVSKCPKSAKLKLHPRFPSRKCQRGQNWHEGLHNEVFIVIHRDANCTLQERECVCQAQFHFMQLWFSLNFRKLCVQVEKKCKNELNTCNLIYFIEAAHLFGINEARCAFKFLTTFSFSTHLQRVCSSISSLILQNFQKQWYLSSIYFYRSQGQLL